MLAGRFVRSPVPSRGRVLAVMSQARLDADAVTDKVGDRRANRRCLWKT